MSKKPNREVVDGTEMGYFFLSVWHPGNPLLLQHVYSLIIGRAEGSTISLPAKTRLASCHNTDEDTYTTWVFVGDTKLSTHTCAGFMHIFKRTFTSLKKRSCLFLQQQNKYVLYKIYLRLKNKMLQTTAQCVHLNDQSSCFAVSP